MTHILVVSPSLSSEDGVGRYSQELVQRFEDDFDVTVLEDVPRHIEVLSDPRKFIRLVRSIRKHRTAVDVVFSFAAFPYSVATYLALSDTDVPYFVSCHATYAVGPLHYPLVQSVTARSYRNAARLFPVSSFTNDKILEEVELSNTTVAPNGSVTSERGDVQPFDLNHKTILTVATLKPRKGQYRAVQAFAEIADEFPEYHYHLVGKDPDVIPYGSRVKRLVEQKGLGDRAHFEGFVTETELQRWYATADLFLLTPQYVNHHFEGNPVVYHEAMQYGVPVIGTNESGAEQAIDHGRSGLCVENSVGAIADAIREILGDRDRYDEFAKGAKRWADETTWDNCAEIIREAMLESLHDHRPKREPQRP